jgi:hypothetical protein
MLAITRRLVTLYVHDVEVCRNCCVERVMAIDKEALGRKMYKAARMLIGEMFRNE